MLHPNVHEDMTVHYVTARYPATQRVFDSLGIHDVAEGYDCLDEVAWRHGMESWELLAHLERVIGSQEVAIDENAYPLHDDAALHVHHRR